MAVSQPYVRVFVNGDYNAVFNATQQALAGVEAQVEAANWQGGTVAGRTPQRPGTWGVRLTCTIWRVDDQNNWRLELTVAPVQPGEILNPQGVQELVQRFVAALGRWHGQGFYITGYA